MSNQKQHNQDEDRSVIRQQNRAMRSITRSLRSQVRRLQEHSDAMFLAICDTQTEAERAFGELWRTGLYDCAPNDYDFMVQETIKSFDKRKQTEQPKRVQEITGDKPKRKFTDS